MREGTDIGHGSFGEDRGQNTTMESMGDAGIAQ